MRVIAGSAGGRKLLVPRGMRVRPTSDRVKEAIFSILISRLGSLEGLRVLDLFAGTGNLGIEALSRGAERAWFVENHRDSLQAIQSNLEVTRFAASAVVIAREAGAAIEQFRQERAVFDLVFLDPPYRKGLAAKTIRQLAAADVMPPEGIVVAEHDPNDQIEDIGSLRIFDTRRYGDTAITLLTGEQV